MANDSVSVSKFLSLILRHKPETIHLALDENGWASVDELIRLANDYGQPITWQLIVKVVEESDKQRFAISEDGLRIRANQGHSINVDLALVPSEPPDELYHGTASRFVASIRANGLRSGRRQYVHLSLDTLTATKVGQRHGKPVILTVCAGAMSADGHKFYLSANGVWLTDHVPVKFLGFPDE